MPLRTRTVRGEHRTSPSKFRRWRLAAAFLSFLLSFFLSLFFSGQLGTSGAADSSSQGAADPSALAPKTKLSMSEAIYSAIGPAVAAPRHLNLASAGTKSSDEARNVQRVGCCRQSIGAFHFRDLLFNTLSVWFVFRFIILQNEG